MWMNPFTTTSKLTKRPYSYFITPYYYRLFINNDCYMGKFTIKPIYY